MSDSGKTCTDIQSKGVSDNSILDIVADQVGLRAIRVDAYLSIAETVLRAVRRPLSARQILDQAYLSHIVPTQLHGQTQHKTLGARLSEDILLSRDRSAFFRTSPGRFFLRSFLTDPAIPEKFRIPLIARRRRRELTRGALMSFSYSTLPQARSSREIAVSTIKQLLRQNKYRYVDARSERAHDEVCVWSFVMVTRGSDVLSYRHGRYRENRDTFLQHRSIGFFAPVVETDNDLFDNGDKGIIAAGLRAVMLDLDFPFSTKGEQDSESDIRLECFIGAKSETSNDLLGVVRFECPNWFEPLRRRLAINDLNWMNLSTPVNNIADFDPWSQRVLEWAQHTGLS